MTIFTPIQANMWVTSVRRQEIFYANISIKFLEWELLFDNETCVRQIHCRRLSLTEKLPPKDWLSKNFRIYCRKAGTSQFSKQ